MHAAAVHIAALVDEMDNCVLTFNKPYAIKPEWPALALQLAEVCAEHPVLAAIPGVVGRSGGDRAITLEGSLDDIAACFEGCASVMSDCLNMQREVTEYLPASVQTRVLQLTERLLAEQAVVVTCAAQPGESEMAVTLSGPIDGVAFAQDMLLGLRKIKPSARKDDVPIHLQAYAKQSDKCNRGMTCYGVAEPFWESPEYQQNELFWLQQYGDKQKNTAKRIDGMSRLAERLLGSLGTPAIRQTAGLDREAVIAAGGVTLEEARLAWLAAAGNRDAPAASGPQQTPAQFDAGPGPSSAAPVTPQHHPVQASYAAGHDMAFNPQQAGLTAADSQALFGAKMLGASPSLAGPAEHEMHFAMGSMPGLAYPVSVSRPMAEFSPQQAAYYGQPELGQMPAGMGMDAVLMSNAMQYGSFAMLTQWPQDATYAGVDPGSGYGLVMPSGSMPPAAMQRGSMGQPWDMAGEMPPYISTDQMAAAPAAYGSAWPMQSAAMGHIDTGSSFDSTQPAYAAQPVPVQLGETLPVVPASPAGTPEGAPFQGSVSTAHKPRERGPRSGQSRGGRGRGRAGSDKREQRTRQDDRRGSSKSGPRRSDRATGQPGTGTGAGAGGKA